MDLLLGGSLIAAGLLLLRRAKRASGGPTIHASKPGTAHSTPQSVAPAASASTPAVEELSTHPEAPSGNTMPLGEYEQFINKNGLQAFVLRVNMETDPDRKEDMKLALVDYYREKVNPNDQTSSDTQILTALGVKLPQRSDTAPEGTVIGDEISDASKSVAWNKYTDLNSKRDAQNKILDDYYTLRKNILNNRVQLQKDGVYDERIKKVNEDIEACRNLIKEIDREIEKVKPQYDEEKRKEEEKKRKEEEEKRRREREAEERSKNYRNEGYIAPDRPEDPVGHNGAGHNTYDNGGSLRPGKKPRNLNETRAIVDIPLMGPIEGIG